MQRGARLHVPTRPGVSQIGPAEVLDTRSLQRFLPSLRVHLLDGLPLVGEHVAPMLADLATHNCHSIFVERDDNRLPGLRLIRVNPPDPTKAIQRFFRKYLSLVYSRT